VVKYLGGVKRTGLDNGRRGGGFVNELNYLFFSDI
jgi:hypothetical protein